MSKKFVTKIGVGFSCYMYLSVVSPSGSSITCLSVCFNYKKTVNKKMFTMGIYYLNVFRQENVDVLLPLFSCFCVHRFVYGSFQVCVNKR